MKNITDMALRVFDAEMNALKVVREMLESNNSKFKSILSEMMDCKGKIIVTGMGKSGHIAKKIAATMSSLGSSAFCLHPGEAMHGDLGMVQESDLIIAISNSGESEEIVRILPNINRIGAKLIGLTSNANSTLAINSYICEVFPPFSEACLLGLAPTSSTTAVLVYGDALALVASELRNFGKNNYALFHPAGSLGKKLIMRVSDCMIKYDTNAFVLEDSVLSEAITALCKTCVDIIPVYDNRHNFVGTFSFREIETAIVSQKNIYKLKITDYVNRDPTFISSDEMAIEALKIMINKNNGCEHLLVLDEEEAVGIIYRENITERGIYI